MSGKKILLIEPPYHRLYKSTYSLDLYPLGLGYLAEAVKKNTDWQAMVYNADFTPESERRKIVYETGEGFYKYLDNLKDLSSPIWSDVRSVIREFKPAVLGISTKSQNFKSACAVAGIAKEIDKNIIVVLGGPHPSMAGEAVFKNPDIDISASGEGEITIVELLKAIGQSESLDRVKGISYRANGTVIKNDAQGFIEDLDSLPFPYENTAALLKDYKRYPKEAFKSVFATRGCPHDCIFCGSRKIWSRKVRFRSPENVVKEIKTRQAMGLGSVSFEDDYFGITKKYVFDLCGAIMEQCPGLKWSCEIHVKLVNDETIAMMKKAGCFSIRLGIESGNNGMLKTIHKNITIEEALSACRTIKRHGIDLHVFYMIGFPQETEETLLDTFEAMKKTRCDLLIYSIFTPYPGTDVFDLCREQGTIKDDYDVSLYNHQSPLNYFCPSIPKEKFRALAEKIEGMVDKKNRMNRIRRIFSLNIIWRVKEKGILKSLRAGMQTILGK